jgi:hypothetical protein
MWCSCVKLGLFEVPNKRGACLAPSVLCRKPYHGASASPRVSCAESLRISPPPSLQAAEIVSAPGFCSSGWSGALIVCPAWQGLASARSIPFCLPAPGKRGSRARLLAAIVRMKRDHTRPTPRQTVCAMPPMAFAQPKVRRIRQRSCGSLSRRKSIRLWCLIDRA